MTVLKLAARLMVYSGGCQGVAMQFLLYVVLVLVIGAQVYFGLLVLYCRALSFNYIFFPKAKVVH